MGTGVHVQVQLIKSGLGVLGDLCQCHDFISVGYLI